MNSRHSADMFHEEPMPPHPTADRHDWLAELDRRLRRQRRATVLASSIAGCMALVGILEALIFVWK